VLTQTFRKTLLVDIQDLVILAQTHDNDPKIVDGVLNEMIELCMGSFQGRRGLHAEI